MAIVAGKLAAALWAAARGAAIATALGLFVVGGLTAASLADEPAAGGSAPPEAGRTAELGPAGLGRFVEAHCIECHDRVTKAGAMALDELLPVDLGGHPQVWEKVVRRLTARQMPPREATRPDEQSYRQVIAWLESQLDATAAAQPDPGRTETFRRLSLAEYKNAVRDLLALEIDAAVLLPADESSHSFDSPTLSEFSPAVLNRYVAAAQKISRTAIGRAPPAPAVETIRVRPDITQDSHVAGLPLGTRGGLLIGHHFVQDGEYEVQVRLMRDRNEGVEGLTEPHQLEILLDRQRVGAFEVAPPPKGESDQNVDANLNARFQVAAGQHRLGVTFVHQSSALLETRRQPLNVHYNFYRHPRLGPAVYQVSIVGPRVRSGAGQSASRGRIFVCRPNGSDDEGPCAETILRGLARRAYRRSVTDDDVRPLLGVYRQGRAQGNFEAGIELALSALLVSPQFLFRIEREPAGIEPGNVYHVGDEELASRLSFFLWSSIPDDDLLELAERGELGRPDVLQKQVRRMLADPRSESLASNFAAQWLHLRNLDSFVPDMRLFPDFDDNLRQSLRRETELVVESVVREDRSVLDLIRTDSTYLDERLARHYGVPHVYGSRFRRVAVDQASHRGGLLRHGSVLAVTSYATRTSPVLRGQWVLKNLLGMPAPPPPPNVPALADNAVSADLPVRERLNQHRANAACAGCHEQIDPVGFALENFDAVGRWRDSEGQRPVDAAGGLGDGSQFVGVAGLEGALLEREESFVRTLVEKMLSFALGRGIEHYDAPAVRQIVRGAASDGYRFSRLVLGIVNSVPFRMRKAL